MSRLSNSPAAAEDSNCFFCGNAAESGGFWKGYSGSIIVCSNCISRASEVFGKIIGDAITDSNDHQAWKNPKSSIHIEINKESQLFSNGAYQTIAHQFWLDKRSTPDKLLNE